MRAALTRYFLYLTYFVSTMPKRASAWFQIRVLRAHSRTTVLTDSTTLAGHVSIVVCYPRAALLSSTLRLLSLLRDSGSTTVVILNESRDADMFASALAGHSDVLLRRPNIGRDFGGYQAGYRFVVANADPTGISRLAFFNDSVFFGPDSANLVDKMLRSDLEATALYVNLQGIQHLQTFAFALSGEVALSAPVRAFWDNYYPSDIRRRVIHSGECGLSQVLIRQGVPLEAVVTASALSDALHGEWSELTFPEVAALWLWVRGQDPVKTAKRYGGTSTPAGRRSANVVTGSNVVTETLVRQAFTTRNPSHALGLPCARLLGAPLKLDLVLHGVCSVGDFEAVLEDMKVSPRERQVVVAMIMGAGSDASLTGIKGRWRRLGLS